MMKSKLAIVIPAYNVKYLSDTLKSLSLQSCKNFKIYIGDDCSPGKLINIINKYRDQLDIEYVFFKKNLGKEDLIKQWNRSVRLSNEEWVWLLSDDDLADKYCVENFYHYVKIHNDKYLVYRFNTRLIDSESRVLDISPPHSNAESPLEFILHRLQGNRHGCISNFIFTRKMFNKEGGFVNFPVGWYSDDASLAAFSQLKDIYTISKSRVSYRIWSGNLSSKKSNSKIDALFLYIEWINDRYGNCTGDLDNYLQNIKKFFKGWVIDNIIDLGGVSLKKILPVSSMLSAKFKMGVGRTVMLILLINLYSKSKKIFKT
jgi:glycosyltransferase involved in cell wall biosynthesis